MRVCVEPLGLNESYIVVLLSPEEGSAQNITKASFSKHRAAVFKLFLPGKCHGSVCEHLPIFYRLLLAPSGRNIRSIRCFTNKPLVCTIIRGRFSIFSDVLLGEKVNKLNCWLLFYTDYHETG